MTWPAGVSASQKGTARATPKNTWAAIHIGSAEATVLKILRSHVLRHRHDRTSASAATAMVAAAGPNSSAIAMKKVSATETRADTEAILIVNEPASKARPANRSHGHGRAVMSTAR